MEKPLERKKLSDEISERLETKILNGTLSNDGLVFSRTFARSAAGST